MSVAATGDEVLQTLRARNGGDVRLIAHVGNDDDASQVGSLAAISRTFWSESICFPL